MLNHITIMGRLTRDPELRSTQGGISVASFTLAVDRDLTNKQTGERDTDFIDVAAWRGTAEFAAKHFHKGSMMVVSGRLQIREWTDQNNNKRRNAEVVADNIYFGESKSSSAHAGTSKLDSFSTYAENALGEGFKEVEDDGELPF